MKEIYRDILVNALAWLFGAIAAVLLIKSCVTEKEHTVQTEVKTDVVIGEEKEVIKEVIRDTIFLPSTPKIVNNIVTEVVKEIVVDSTYKAKYLKALKLNDSITARNLFLEGITINKYNDTLVSDENIVIKGAFETRGLLLSYDIDYKILEQKVKCNPKVIKQFPKRSFVLGTTLGIPTLMKGDISLGLNAGLQYNTGDIVTVGFDTNKVISINFSKSFSSF